MNLLVRIVVTGKYIHVFLSYDMMMIMNFNSEVSYK